MSIKAFFLLVCVTLAMAGCGGGGGDDTAIAPQQSVSYVTWRGSSNGAFVLDATNDLVQFRADNGQMVFSNTSYRNITVNSAAQIYFNGALFGSVTNILSSDNVSIVTAMLCNNGSFADISGSNPNLILSCTNLYPIAAPVSAPPATVSAPTAKATGLLVTTTGISPNIDATTSVNQRATTLTYEWTLLKKPATSSATLSTTAVKPNLVPDVDGVYTIALVVNDGTDNSLPLIFSVTSIPTGRITLNSTAAQVTAVLGNPTSINNYSTTTVWNYGTNSITLSAATATSSSKVLEWTDSSTNALKVILVVGNNLTAGATKLTVGSTKDDVIKLQGTPTSIYNYSTETVWYYGTASITISNSTYKVTAWSQSGTILHL